MSTGGNSRGSPQVGLEREFQVGSPWLGQRGANTPLPSEAPVSLSHQHPLPNLSIVALHLSVCLSFLTCRMGQQHPSQRAVGGLGVWVQELVSSV